MVIASKEEILASKLVKARKALADYLAGDCDQITDARTDALADAEYDAEQAVVEFLIKSGKVSQSDADALRFAAEQVATAFAAKVLA